MTTILRQPIPGHAHRVLFSGTVRMETAPLGDAPAVRQESFAWIGPSHLGIEDVTIRVKLVEHLDGSATNVADLVHAKTEEVLTTLAATNVRSPVPPPPVEDEVDEDWYDPDDTWGDDD